MGDAAISGGFRCSCGLPARRRLDAVQLPVRRASGQPLLMRAAFGDAGAVEHHDEVRHAHGAEAVRQAHSQGAS
jgi:hypothetical protein